MRTRIALGTIGVLILAYGSWRLLGTPRLTRPTTVGVWLLAALVLHDAVLAPLTIAVGFLLGAVLRPRARRYVAGALVAGGLVTAVALPIVYRRGQAPPGTTLEAQDYVGHLLLILAAIAAVTAGAYVIRVVRDRTSQPDNEANDLPPADQVSTTP